MALTITPANTHNSTSAGTTWTSLQLGVTFAVGDILVIILAADNAGASGSATNVAALSNATGFGSISEQQNAVFDNGAASAGSEIAIITAECTSARASTDTVQINFTNSVTSKAAVFWKVSTDVAAERAVILSSGVNTGSTTGTPTVTSGTIPVGGAVIGGIANETNAAVTADGDATNGSWSSQQTATGNTGTLLTSMRVASQYKIQTTTASTQTYNPTMTSCDTIAGWISFGVKATPTPNPIAVPITVPAAEGRAGSTVSVAAAIAVPITVPAVTGQGGATGSPDALAVVATLPAVEARAGSAPTAVPIAVPVTFPAFEAQAGSRRSVSPISIAIKKPYTRGGTRYMYPMSSAGGWGGTTVNEAISMPHGDLDSGQSFNPTESGGDGGIYVSADGTKLWIYADNVDIIYRYTLATPYSIASGSPSYDSVSKDISADVTDGNGFTFAPDGLTFYVLDVDGLHSFEMSGAFDITTAVHTDLYTEPAGSGATLPRGFTFNDDGTLLYWIRDNEMLERATLSVAWDITTAVLDEQRLIDTVSAQSWGGIAIYPDGITMLLFADGATTAILTLHEPWSIADAEGLFNFTHPSGGASQIQVDFDNMRYYTFESGTVRRYTIDDTSNAQQYVVFTPAAYPREGYVQAIPSDTVASFNMSNSPAAFDHPATDVIVRVYAERVNFTDDTVAMSVHLANSGDTVPITTTDVIVPAGGNSSGQIYEVTLRSLVTQLAQKSAWDAAFLFLSFSWVTTGGVDSSARLRVYAVEVEYDYFLSTQDEFVSAGVGATPAPDPAQLVITLPAVTATANGDATANPDAIPLVATLPAVEAQAGSTLSVDPIAVPITVPAAEGQGGAGAFPATMSLPITLPAVEAQSGSTPAPAAIAVVATLPAVDAQAGSTVAVSPIATPITLPAVSAGAGAVPTPSPTDLVITIPAATPSAGATPAPSPIPLVATIPAVTAQAGATTSPSPIPVVVTIPQATPQAGATPAVAPTSVVITVPAAEARAGSTPAVSPIATVITMPAAEGQAGATVSPAAVALAVTVPQASAQSGVSATPDPIALAVTVPAAEVRAGSTVSPAVLATVITIPQATPASGSTTTPSPIAVPITVPQATPGAGASPPTSPIAVPITLPAAQTQAGAGPTPSPIAVPITMPAAAGQAGSTVTPAQIDVVLTMPAVSASGGTASTANPSPIALVITLPAAEARAGATASPVTLQLAITLQAAAPQAGSTVVVQVIAMPVTMPAVTGQGGATALPTPVSVVTDIPSTTQHVGAGPTPTPIVATITIPTPQLEAGSTIAVDTLMTEIVLPAVLAQGFDFAVPDAPYTSDDYPGPRTSDVVERDDYSTGGYQQTQHTTDEYPGPRQTAGYPGPRRSG